MPFHRHISSIGLLLTLAFATLIEGCGDQSPPANTSTESTSPASAGVQSPVGEVSIEQLKSQADKGDADAMFKLSMLYREGNGVESNYALFESYLQKAVSLNHREAIVRLAEETAMPISIYRLIEGKNSAEKLKYAEKTFAEVVRLYNKAIELGSDEAEVYLAYHLLRGLDDAANANGIKLSGVPAEYRGNSSRAYTLYEAAAAKGNPNGMVAMYRFFKEKIWGRQNAELAGVWMRKMEAVVDPRVIYKIGDLLYYGFLADKRGPVFIALDDKFKPELDWVRDSQPFLERAANAGMSDAQVLLSRVYLGGFGGYKSPKEAAKWLEKASANGDEWAQVTLGRLYMTGDGVLQNFSPAVKLFEQAAVSSINSKDDGKWTVEEPKVWEAQYLLGVLNEKGLGVQKDLVRAHAWYNIAATNGFEKAVPARNALTPQLTAEQLTEAQALAKNWKPGSKSLIGGAAEKSGAIAAAGAHAVKVGTGTIFVVSKTGHAITNQHVAGGCSELHVQGRDGLAKLLNEDKINDLALLQLQGAVADTATITAEPGKLRQGDEIAAFGFPLKSVLSSGGNLTPGVVSALTGIGNNINQIQITAQIQPGSSGSPVLNKKGEVVGVVSRKLDDGTMVNATGHIGQNINFAISGQTLKTFLDTHKVPYSTGGFLSREKSTADLADEARKWTLVVECWK
jgi:TPR repeat protein